MADFKKALAEGFVAAEKAEIARKEVQQILEKLKADILAASEGKLLLEIRTFEEPKGAAESWKTGVSVVEIYQKALEPKKIYEALMASNPKVAEKRFKELARWKQAKDGYPCSLIWGKQERQCEDRAALEEGLAELLKDPVVGEKLYSLTQLA
jgi:hypothetical protein